MVCKCGHEQFFIKRDSNNKVIGSFCGKCKEVFLIGKKTKKSKIEDDYDSFIDKIKSKE